MFSVIKCFLVLLGLLLAFEDGDAHWIGGWGRGWGPPVVVGGFGYGIYRPYPRPIFYPPPPPPPFFG